uniref:Uncharacterized protein n=1 Tax=Setaria viridis TaxID=4556 RepID=A0A4U6V935_SETVI|nr:LOW QUALITY PROTEIN: hypothetical protein SEVIR_3G062000v2 [Setaria viridis]
MAGAETCKLSTSVNSVKLRVQILKWFRRRRICENLLKKGQKIKKMVEITAAAQARLPPLPELRRHPSSSARTSIRRPSSSPLKLHRPRAPPGALPPQPVVLPRRCRGRPELCRHRPSGPPPVLRPPRTPAPADPRRRCELGELRPCTPCAMPPLKPCRPTLGPSSPDLAQPPCPAESSQDELRHPQIGGSRASLRSSTPATGSISTSAGRIVTGEATGPCGTPMYGSSSTVDAPPHEYCRFKSTDPKLRFARGGAVEEAARAWTEATGGET